MIATLTSCRSQNELSALHWLAGKWEYVEMEPASCEEWEITQTGIMKGIGSSIIDGKTVVIERMQISQTDGQLVFSFDIGEGKTTTLKLEQQSKDTVVFGNPDIEFPQKLSYIRTSDTTRQTTISGILEGQACEMKFELRKSK